MLLNASETLIDVILLMIWTMLKHPWTVETGRAYLELKGRT
jgi:hypothetical protein